MDFWFCEQGEVYIRGRKRVGLIDDEELSGLRIGLVRIIFKLHIILEIIWKMTFYRSMKLWNPTSVREGNEIFLIRVRKPLPSRRVLKPWGEAQRGIFASWGLELLQMVLEPAPDGVLAKTLGPQGGGLWDLTSVGEENEAFLIRVRKLLMLSKFIVFHQGKVLSSIMI